MLDPESITDPACTGVIGQYHAAGLEVRIWDTTTDVGIASFHCLLMERDGEDVDPEFGSGCHPARQVALLRALTEAGQARNTYITGARDDYFPHLYSAAARERRKATCRALLAPSPGPARAFEQVPSFESAAIEDDLAWMLARLRGAGIDQVVAVDLTRAAIGVPVARVIVPGLEGVMTEAGGSDYAPGARARRLFAL
jgi:ribosomal protein S12 methylthiotransferase accessory factor